MPPELRTPKYALLIPLLSAAVVGFFSAKGYEMSGHMRADAMGVTSGLMMFWMERVAWYLTICAIERDEPYIETVDARQAIKGMWSRAEQSAPDVTGVTEYDLSITQESRFYRTQGASILISKRLEGDAPWLVLPVDMTRYQLEGFYQTVILQGKAPTEKNLAGWGKPFSQLELRTWRDWLYKNDWLVYLRHGNNAPWRLTPRGRRVVEYIYRMLQGRPDKAGRWIDSPTRNGANGRRANS